MGLFDFFRAPDITDMANGAKESGAHLVDVRTPEEYEQGHINGSINVPLDTLPGGAAILGKNEKIYVYCRSGARSGRAAAILGRSGYTDVTNIGGIMDYRGRITAE